ncbi:hypothetical protein ACFLRC_03855 [Candidatus Altiarchaeota archaeon]
MKEKGFVVTWDALFALVLVFITITTFASVQKFRPRSQTGTELQAVHSTSQDVMEVLATKGILEEVGQKWADGEMDDAKIILDEAMAIYAPPNMGYKFYINETNITEGGIIPEEDARFKASAVRVVSGFYNESNASGYLARAWMIQNQTAGTINTLSNTSNGTPELFLTYTNFTINESEWNVSYLRVPIGVNVFSATFVMDVDITTTTIQTCQQRCDLECPGSTGNCASTFPDLCSVNSCTFPCRIDGVPECTGVTPICECN